MSPVTRHLIAVGADGKVYSEATHLDWTHVVVYHDGVGHTWHHGRARARKYATHPGDVILKVREKDRA